MNSSVKFRLPAKLDFLHLSGQRVSKSFHLSRARRWISTAFSISGSSDSQSSKSCGRTFPPSGNLIPLIFHSSIILVIESNRLDKLSTIAVTSEVMSSPFLDSKRSANSLSKGRMSFSILSLLLRALSALDCKEVR